MYYGEVLFARSRLFWFTVVALAVAAVFTYFVTFPPPHAHVVNNGQDVPFDGVVAFAGFMAMIMASMLAATMNRDGSHLAFTWTKPIARERTALMYIAVDILTIVAAFVVILTICTLVLALPPRNHMMFDEYSAAMVARSLAIPLMLFGIVEVATSWTPMRLAAAGGLVWPIGFAIEFLAEINLPFPLGQLFKALNVINPMAYIPEIHVMHHVSISPSTALPLDFIGQTTTAFCIAAIGLAVATYNWKRMQA